MLSWRNIQLLILVPLVLVGGIMYLISQGGFSVAEIPFLERFLPARFPAAQSGGIPIASPLANPILTIAVPPESIFTP